MNINTKIIKLFPEDLISNSNTHFTDMYISLSYVKRLKKQNTYETKIILTIHVYFFKWQKLMHCFQPTEMLIGTCRHCKKIELIFDAIKKKTVKDFFNLKY